MKNIYIILGIAVTLLLISLFALNKEESSPKYRIEKVLEISCNKDSDCETPMNYLIQSRCPFSSKCFGNKCTVICPDF